jgi:hypothetical protein
MGIHLKRSMRRSVNTKAMNVAETRFLISPDHSNTLFSNISANYDFWLLEPSNDRVISTCILL